MSTKTAMKATMMTDRNDPIRMATLVVVTASLLVTVWWVSTTSLYVLGMRYGLWLYLVVN